MFLVKKIMLQGNKLFFNKFLHHPEDGLHFSDMAKSMVPPKRFVCIDNKRCKLYVCPLLDRLLFTGTSSNWGLFSISRCVMSLKPARAIPLALYLNRVMDAFMICQDRVMVVLSVSPRAS